MFALVNTTTGEITQISSLSRVDVPGGIVAFACEVGQEWGDYKIFNIDVVSEGDGPVLDSVSLRWAGQAVQEVKTWRQPNAAEVKKGVQEQIQALEESCTPRRWREAVMSDAGKAWLANVDAQIAALRAQL